MTGLHHQYFPNFFKAQLDEMDRHYPEKGDGWYSSSPGEIMELYDRVSLELHKRFEAGDFKGLKSQTIDVGNVVAMLNLVLGDTE